MFVFIAMENCSLSVSVPEGHCHTNIHESIFGVCAVSGTSVYLFDLYIRVNTESALSRKYRQWHTGRLAKN